MLLLVFELVAMAGESLGDEVLQTNEGLRLEFSDQAQLTRVDIGSTTLPLKRPGGFSVADHQRPPALVNLVPNPGFEEGTQGWRLEKGQTLDTTIAHDGRASMRLEVLGPEPGTTNLGATLPVKPHTAYRVGMWVRGRHIQRGSGGGPGFFYSELDEQGRHVGVHQVGASVGPQDDRWVQISWNLVTRPDTRKLLLRGTLFRTTGTLWLDDFLIAEALDMPQTPLTGTIQRQTDGSLRSQARLPDVGVALEATYRVNGDAIHIDGVLSDLTGRDRALGLRFGLPLDLQGWRWYDDAEDFQVIEPYRTYQNTFACEAGAGTCSRYAWSALTGPRAGLSVAVPLAQGPRVYILQHNQRIPETSLTFFFGLTKDAGQNPSRAPFSFVLYPHDPAWGMRSAMERYYRMFPESFQKRLRYEGYYNYGNLEVYRPQSHEVAISNGQGKGVPDASDFGEGYEFLWHLHGCYDYHQFATDDRAMPKDDQVKTWLAQASGRRTYYTPEAETLKKLVYGPDGEIRYIFDTQYWRAREGYNLTDKPGWGLNCRVNEDPDISPFLADLTRKHLERYASKPRHRPFSACLTADAIDGYFSDTQGLDYRREHFATTLAPLTFGRQNLKPAIFNTIWDFHYKAWWPLSEQYQVVTYGNGNVPSALTTMPFIDISMIEGRWGRAARPREERFWRATAYQKIWRFWCLNTRWYSLQHPLDPKQVVQALGEGLASAIFPPLETVPRALGSIEPCRAAYRQYVPAIEELSAAGWEPVPHASAGQDVIVERFGSAHDGQLHFTLRNYADQPKQVLLRLDRRALGIADRESLVAINLVPGTPELLALEGDVLAARVEADNSRAFWVGSRRQAAARGLRQAGVVLDKIERLFATELEPVVTGLLEQGRQLSRSNQPTLQTAEALQELAGKLQSQLRTKSPIDLAKLVLRLRTQAAMVPAAILSVQSRAPRVIEEGMRGKSVSVAWDLAGESLGDPDRAESTALSPWSDLAASSRCEVRRKASGACTLEATLPVPAEPERSLLPFLLTYRGESQDGRFTLVTPIDVVVAESVQMSFQPDHVVRGVPLRVRLRLENRQPEAAQVRVKLAPPQHVEVTPLETEVDLPGSGSVEREITLNASSQCMLGRAWVPYTLHSTAANCRSRGSLFLWVAGSPKP